MQRIILTIGISGSGKTTWASKFCEMNDEYIRVNRDAIRMQITGSNSRLLDREKENLVTKIQDEQVRAALNDGYNVIIDNTNLNKKYIEEFKLKYGHIADIVFKQFDIHPERAKLLVSKRDNTEKVDYIDRQYSQYRQLTKELAKNYVYKREEGRPAKDYIEGKEDVAICDLDGSLALFGSKSPYERDFENDIINEQVLNILWGAISNPKSSVKKVFFFSGRNSKYREQTLEFLNKCGFADKLHFELHMRKENDMRRDSLVKMEMYEELIRGKYNLSFVIDDRLQVIEEVWNKIGAFVLNVNQGNKRF